MWKSIAIILYFALIIIATRPGCNPVVSAYRGARQRREPSEDGPMSRVIKRKAVWRVIVVNRPGLDLLPFDEEPLKRTFSTKQAAEQWAREHFGSSPRDREGWRVERDSVRYVGERQVPQLFHSTD